MPLVQENDPQDGIDEPPRDKARIEELPTDDEDSAFESVNGNDHSEVTGVPSLADKTIKSKPRRSKDAGLPPWLHEAALDLFHDYHMTKTVEVQEKVMRECLPLLRSKNPQGFELNRHGIPRLRREAHVSFLHGTIKPLPAPFMAVDASRPWLFYWALAGLSTLGEDVTPYCDRLCNSVRPLQNVTGGFGGGHGQLSHCAVSYATVLALAVAGRLDAVDRATMWQWLGRVKAADGGFYMAVGAEEDIRGAYCAMTIITLLNLPLELPPDAPARAAGLTTFVDGLGEWVGRCQTYEGGIGGAPTNEAHGAYAFCALACLSILDAPHVSIPAHLDVGALASWLAARQVMPEGGFAGRQEKLVDSCYAHWVGGCWDLIQAAMSPHTSTSSPNDAGTGDLWNRAALIRYLLCCAQQPSGRKVPGGGMRDKPSTRPDGYHTCYSLAGLSHAQNKYTYDCTAAARDAGNGRLLAAFNWGAERANAAELREWKIDQADVVNFVHPVFTLPMEAVELARVKFEASAL